MSNFIRDQLTDYYQQKGIHPEQFDCQHQAFCRSFACQNDMTEAKMSMVGSRYGTEYPRIVVVSFDPPNQGNFVQPHQRTTTYITAKHETDNYSSNRPNPHWAITQIIVKDLLCLFGYKAQAGAAVVEESYSGRPIENISPYFAHVNVAKCSMNHVAKRQAHRKVHQICSHSYLRGELAILQPEILISQGNATNEILSILLLGDHFSANDLPAVRQVNVGKKATVWLLMHHPARQIVKIRQYWNFYLAAVEEWKKAWTS